MKAVIYARYSSDSQREESIEGQLREYGAFVEKNGIRTFTTEPYHPFERVDGFLM